jgi:prepilin-type N-terminal cleavage/methylation domain-containing protein
MMFRTKSQSGFSLVEMIVSIAVFAVVVTIAVGALLMLIASNEKLQEEQSVMTNLSFALDSMTREIRTGTEYYCANAMANNNNVFDDGEDLNTILSDSDVNDCTEGSRLMLSGNSYDYHGIAFIEGGSSITGTGGRILYYFDKDANTIYRRVGSGDSQSIVSSGLVIEDAEFFVTGSTPLGTPPDNTQKDQSSVTIIIKAREVGASTKVYELQTTVTQRTLDI